MEQYLSNKRNDIYDIVRGVLMILVVMGHCGAPFTREIYSFHVPAFFFLSGMLYKRKIFNAQNLIEVFTKRIKRLYLPYLGFALFFTILYIPFQGLDLYVTEESLSIYPDIPHTSVASPINVYGWMRMLVSSFLFSGGTQLCGAIWFLRVLFISSVILDLECFLLKKSRNFSKLFLLINIILGLLGIICSSYNITLPLNFDAVLTVMIFYIAGYFLKEVINIYCSFLEHRKISYFIVLILVFPIVILGNNMSVNIGANQYSSIVSLMISSFVGVIFTFSIANLILKSTFLKWAFLTVGQNTIAILGLHFLSFKIVTLCIIKLYNSPMSYLGAFPILDDSFWLIYTIVGVSIPVLLNYSYGILIDKIGNSYKSIKVFNCLNQK